MKLEKQIYEQQIAFALKQAELGMRLKKSALHGWVFWLHYP